jgi:hypothetical protein
MDRIFRVPFAGAFVLSVLQDLAEKVFGAI